jgi:hypothetical protein
MSSTTPAPDPAERRSSPELDKQRAIIDSGAAETVGEFIDWLASAGYLIGRYERMEGYREQVLVPVRLSPEQLLAQHFGIDLDKIEAERRAILAALQPQGDQS